MVYIAIPLILISFLGGVALRSFFIFSDITLFIVGGVAFALLIISVLFKFYKILIFALFILSFLGGVLRVDIFERGILKDQLHTKYNEVVQMEGVVTSNRIREKSQQLTVKTEEGNLRVITRTIPQFHYGDIVFIDGKLLEPQPFGDYNTPKILSKDKIYTEMIFPKIESIGFSPPSAVRSTLYAIRDAFEERLQNALPEPYASLADGMLLGNEGVLSDQLRDAFRRSGTIHILVLSGYNITIVSSLFLILFKLFLRESVAWIGAVLAIILFTLMTGAEAPAVRAAIMATIGLVALWSGRKNVAFIALIWSAVFMVLWNPMILVWDRGFQLSILATLGLATCATWFTKKLRFLPNFFLVRESAAATLAAQLFVMPLLLSWGSSVSVLSPIANIFVVTLVPFVMFFSFLSALLSFLAVSLGVFIGTVAYALISFQIFVAEFISGFNSVIVSFSSLPIIFLIFIYSFLFWLSWRGYLKSA